MACEQLLSLGQVAIEADWEGYNHWADRKTGHVVAEPPYPVPPGWLERFAWKISRPKVAALAASTRDTTAYLCGSVENEAEVRDLFDLMVCLVVDDDTVLGRLQSRTTNAFGKHPEELAAALEANAATESGYRRLGASIIDGGRPPAQVAEAILAAAKARLALQLRAFPAELASVVAGWARTDEEALMWCGARAAPVPTAQVSAWAGEEGVAPFGLFRGQRLVGYGELWVDEREAEVELARLIIDPADRGRGLGRHLAAELGRLARPRQPRVMLRVHPANAAALRCYAAAGFRPVAPDQAAV